MTKICLKNFVPVMSVCAFFTFVFIILFELRIEWQTLNYKSYKNVVHQMKSHVPTLREQLKTMLNCSDKELTLEILQYGSYWLIRNLITGSFSKKVSCAETITYTANADYSFFHSLPVVTKSFFSLAYLFSWLAPISFAVFAPGYDIIETMASIQYVRNCLPESKLIRLYVSFHIFYPNDHMPTNMPRNEAQALAWSYDCEAPAPYLDVDRQMMYKTEANLTYPINVGRNIARKSVNTYFVFACDVELIPSPNIAQKFLKMVAQNESLIRGNNGLRVFSLPVFEIASNATIPKTKTELKTMLETKIAIPFHAMICKTCHRVPHQAKWLSATDTKDFSITAKKKRQAQFVHWEPFYISDNREPMFDERVTWEGQSNKRIQNFAMCLLNYEYLVVHPAFLVHMPGFKYFDEHSPRQKYVPTTNLLIEQHIKPEYRTLYGDNVRCDV